MALDDNLLITGSADSCMRVWLPKARDPSPDVDQIAARDQHRFDVSAPYFDLPAHNGPISSLSLTDCALFSGSWDCSVRTFLRGSGESYGPAGLSLSNVLHFSDCEFRERSIISSSLHSTHIFTK